MTDKEYIKNLNAVMHHLSLDINSDTSKLCLQLRQATYRLLPEVIDKETLKLFQQMSGNTQINMVNDAKMVEQKKQTASHNTLTDDEIYELLRNANLENYTPEYIMSRLNDFMKERWGLLNKEESFSKEESELYNALRILPRTKVEELLYSTMSTRQITKESIDKTKYLEYLSEIIGLLNLEASLDDDIYDILRNKKIVFTVYDEAGRKLEERYKRTIHWFRNLSTADAHYVIHLWRMKNAGILCSVKNINILNTEPKQEEQKNIHEEKSIQEIWELGKQEGQLLTELKYLEKEIFGLLNEPFSPSKLGKLVNDFNKKQDDLRKIKDIKKNYSSNLNESAV